MGTLVYFILVDAPVERLLGISVGVSFLVITIVSDCICFS
jgi:hypothetical protein